MKLFKVTYTREGEQHSQTHISFEDIIYALNLLDLLESVDNDSIIIQTEA